MSIAPACPTAESGVSSIGGASRTTLEFNPSRLEATRTGTGSSAALQPGAITVAMRTIGDLTMTSICLKIPVVKR
ncbi:MAG: hypothetical protein ACKVP4_06685 [Hyphomicrobium sp.]